MILTIRGTHGSGKTTVVREVMKRYTCISPDHEGWRTNPIGYLCQAEDKIDLWVQGSYEAGCGGCDTISDTNEAFEGILEHAEKGMHVLYEGILAQHSTWNVRELVVEAKLPLIAIILTTRLEICMEGVQARRSERGKPPLDNLGNVVKEAKAVGLGAQRLKAMGADVRWLDRDMAVETVLRELGWT